MEIMYHQMLTLTYGHPAKTMVYFSAIFPVPVSCIAAFPVSFHVLWYFLYRGVSCIAAFPVSRRFLCHFPVSRRFICYDLLTASFMYTDQVRLADSWPQSFTPPPHRDTERSNANIEDAIQVASAKSATVPTHCSTRCVQNGLVLHNAAARNEDAVFSASVHGVVDLNSLAVVTRVSGLAQVYDLHLRPTSVCTVGDRDNEHLAARRMSCVFA